MGLLDEKTAVKQNVRIIAHDSAKTYAKTRSAFLPRLPVGFAMETAAAGFRS